jgi:hypothetical protein
MRKFFVLAILIAATGASAGKPASDRPVTSTIADFSAGNAPYDLRSDGGGAYLNGVGGNISILVANAYNGLTWGDWRLETLSSTRTLGITFSTANAVQPGDLGYTAPANPPYWGTQWVSVRMENKCTFENNDMLTMQVGEAFACQANIRMAPTTSTTYYNLGLGPGTLNTAPEAQRLQVSCNSVDAGGCKDWFLDPIPVVNPDGSTSAGRTRARLVLIDTRGKGSTTNKGDFYLTFHFHVTRP